MRERPVAELIPAEGGSAVSFALVVISSDNKDRDWSVTVIRRCRETTPQMSPLLEHALAHRRQAAPQVGDSLFFGI